MIDVLGGLGIGDCDVDRQRRAWYRRPPSAVCVVVALFRLVEGWDVHVGSRASAAEGTELVRVRRMSDRCTLQVSRNTSNAFDCLLVPAPAYPRMLPSISYCPTTRKLQRDLRPSGFGKESHHSTAVFTTRTTMSSAASAES
jgi:hypothetical protein